MFYFAPQLFQMRRIRDGGLSKSKPEPDIPGVCCLTLKTQSQVIRGNFSLKCHVEDKLNTWPAIPVQS